VITAHIRGAGMRTIGIPHDGHLALRVVLRLGAEEVVEAALQPLAAAVRLGKRRLFGWSAECV